MTHSHNPEKLMDSWGKNFCPIDEMAAAVQYCLSEARRNGIFGNRNLLKAQKATDMKDAVCSQVDWVNLNKNE